MSTDQVSHEIWWSCEHWLDSVKELLQKGGRGNTNWKAQNQWAIYQYWILGNREKSHKNVVYPLASYNYLRFPEFSSGSETHFESNFNIERVQSLFCWLAHSGSEPFQAHRQSFVKGGSNVGVCAWSAREFLKYYYYSWNFDEYVTLYMHCIITFRPNALSSKESISMLQVL